MNASRVERWVKQTATAPWVEGGAGGVRDGAVLRGSDEAPRPGRVPYSYLVLPDAEDAGGHVRRLDARQGVGVAAVDEDDELDLAHRAVGDADVRDAQVLR